jgi:hypothetical protein
MNEDITRAKKIFFKYACNRFFLDREVDAEEYKKFDISNEQENEWYREYVMHWIDRLSVEDMNSLNHLRLAGAGEALPELCRISVLGDSFAKYEYACAIWDIATSAIVSPFVREQARRRLVYLWKSLLEDPIELTDFHRKNISNEGYILDNVRSKLEEAKRRGFFYFLFLSFYYGIIGLLGGLLDLVDKIMRIGRQK